MNVIRITAKSDADGVLRLQLPVGEGEFEVAVTEKSIVNGTPENGGWPAGFLDRMYGAIKDESFMLHPQPSLSPPVDFNG